VGLVDILDVDYNFSLVALVKVLKSFSFFILISLRISNGEPKPKGARQPLSCILDSFNKILKILINIPRSNHSIGSYMCPLRPLFYS
jgi:hypothetical protein